MALTMTAIIGQADKMVPNEFVNADKAAWLNEVNNKFFEIVKIPISFSFSTLVGISEYTLSTSIRGRNITRVQVGTSLHPSFLYEDVPPGHNHHIFNDSTGKIKIFPTPNKAGLTGLVRSYQIATTTYTDVNLSASPDAPGEYHFVYVFGLAQKIAEAMEDIGKANNYGKSFMDNLLVAQQNYAKMSG